MFDTTSIKILHRDEWICTVAKPAGLMVHHSRISTDTIFLVDLLREQLGRRVLPVHRLDRATSGVLLFALDAETAAVLGRQFESGTVAKRYLAIVRGIERPQRTSARLCAKRVSIGNPADRAGHAERQ